LFLYSFCHSELVSESFCFYFFKRSRRAWHGGYFSRKVTQKFPPVVGIVRLTKLAFFAIGKLVACQLLKHAFASANFVGSIHPSSNGGGGKEGWGVVE
jgi:hypothetical protein